MQENKVKILAFLKKARRKTAYERFLKRMLQGLVIGLALSACVSVASLFVPVPYLPLIILGILGTALLAEFAVFLVKYPSLKEAAAAADGLGLKERMSTALENMDCTDDMSVIQRNDAARFTDTDLSKAFRFRPKKLELILLVAFLILTVVPVFIPTVSKERAAEMLDISQAKKEARKRIDETAKEVADEYDLDEAL
ncbi:MAG: hypothetical protein J6U42_08625, partial [Lachnospiraceae bacterium]|nr:hypothetical protein [Lachnospiraceae bacterium]